MELYFFNHEKYSTLYNCSGIKNLDKVVALGASQYVPEAIACILLGVVYHTLYIPCVFSIYKYSHNNPCYQFLFYLSIVDLSTLWVPTFLYGFLGLQGAVFCTNPKLLYFVGAWIGACWCAECSADLMLGVNRCIEVIKPGLAKVLYYNGRVYIWLSISLLYGLHWLIFEKPFIFNGLFFTCFFDPLIGYGKSGGNEFEQSLTAFTIHNYVLAFGTPIIYGTFLVFMFVDIRRLRGAANQTGQTKAERMIFLQVLIISIFNMSAGFVYVKLIHATEPDQFWITIGHFSWINVHGIPPVVYLTLNRTIRNDTLAMFRKAFGIKRNGRVTTIGGLSAANGTNQRINTFH